MRPYELMIILDPEVDERTVAPSLDKLLAVVKTGGGTVEKVDIWGKRRLAYDIKKRSEGIYAVVDMTTTPELGPGARPSARSERGRPAHQAHPPGRSLSIRVATT